MGFDAFCCLTCVSHLQCQARPEMEALMQYMKEEQARGNTEAAVSLLLVLF